MARPTQHDMAQFPERRRQAGSSHVLTRRLDNDERAPLSILSDSMYSTFAPFCFGIQIVRGISDRRKQMCESLFSCWAMRAKNPNGHRHVVQACKVRTTEQHEDD